MTHWRIVWSVSTPLPQLSLPVVCWPHPPNTQPWLIRLATPNSPWMWTPGWGPTQHPELQVLSFVRHTFTEHLFSATQCCGLCQRWHWLQGGGQQTTRQCYPKAQELDPEAQELEVPRQAGAQGGLPAGRLHECRCLTQGALPKPPK